MSVISIDRHFRGVQTFMTTDNDVLHCSVRQTAAGTIVYACSHAERSGACACHPFYIPLTQQSFTLGARTYVMDE